MKSYFITSAFVLLVTEAYSRSGSQWNGLIRSKRYYTSYDDEGRPIFGYVKPSPVYNIPETTTSQLTTKKYYTSYDDEGRPIWEFVESSPVHNIPKKATLQATTEKYYKSFDPSGRPIWETITQDTPIVKPPNSRDKPSNPRDKPSNPWDKPPPPKTTEATTTTTRENTKTPRKPWEGLPPITPGKHNTSRKPWQRPPSFITYNYTRTIDEYTRNFPPFKTSLENQRMQRPDRSNDDKDNPCIKDLPTLKKNNFSAPGKRIALEKCEEFKEVGKYFLEKEKFNAECIAYKKTYNEAHNISEADVQVINGWETEQGEYPHMGALGWLTVKRHYVFKCGGTLISSNFVLTAAHCTKNVPDTTFVDQRPRIVRFGDKNVRSEDKKHSNRFDAKISDIIKHKEYKGKYNDIALLKLEEEVSFNEDVRPACLWHRFDIASFSTKANATGWGITESSKVSSYLRAAELDIFDNKLCDIKLRSRNGRNYNGTRDTQICAGKMEKNIDTCQGDSGGPLQVIKKEEEVFIYYVIGVTSFGFKCADRDTPAIYTRVSSYLDWIESCVWDDINSENCKIYSKKMED